MANIEFAGFLYDDAGVAINGATINLYTRNTTTPVQATTTTNANGYWTISHGTEGRFDVEYVNGTSKRRRKYDDAMQVQEIEAANLLVRNPANTFKYDIVPAAITADRQLNLPLITATDTLATLGLSNNFTVNQYINDTSNANMTLGLTLNQGANDDQILAMKSSDVAHALTSGGTVATETDDWMTVAKLDGPTGGARITSWQEDPAGAQSSMNIESLGGQAGTVSSTTAIPLLTFRLSEHDGANAMINAPAGSLIVGFQRRVAGAWNNALMVDAEGDLHLDGNAGASAANTTVFDEYEDWQLCRAFDLARAPGQVIRDEWDDFVRYNEADLKRAKILSDPQDGGQPMYNLTQHVKLLNGAASQMGKRLLALERQVLALQGGN